MTLRIKLPMQLDCDRCGKTLLAGGFLNIPEAAKKGKESPTLELDETECRGWTEYKDIHLCPECTIKVVNDPGAISQVGGRIGGIFDALTSDKMLRGRAMLKVQEAMEVLANE